MSSENRRNLSELSSYALLFLSDAIGRARIEAAEGADTEWARGFSDYIDRNGRSWGYDVIVLENGDKIFTEYSGTSQTVVNPEGSKRSTFSGVTRYTGGTGKHQGIRGIERSSSTFDPEKNYNEEQHEGEYWFEN